MRIALVILHADAARGGAERYTIDLATSLAARGHDVSLLASTFEKIPAEVKKVHLPAGGATRVRRYRQFLKSLDDAIEAGLRFDIVHSMLPVRKCDLYHPHAGIAADAAAGGFRHRMNRRRVEFAAVEKQLLEGDHPPMVLSLSDVIGRVVEQWYPHLPAACRVKLFNGIDIEKFRPPIDEAETASLRNRFALPTDKILVLMIAQDFVRKGLAPAIGALARLDPSIHLVVAGRDDPRPFKHLAAAKKVSHRIHWIGPTNDPAALHRTADIFVLPTRHDPCSLVVLEALATGVPVVTTAVNGASEIMKTAVHGVVLATPGSVELTRALSNVADQTVRLSMGRMCRMLRPALDWNSHVDLLSGFYKIVEPGYRPTFAR